MEITAPAKTTAQSWGQGPAHTTNKQTNWGHVASGSRVCERQPTMAGVDIWAWGIKINKPTGLNIPIYPRKGARAGIRETRETYEECWTL